MRRMRQSPPVPSLPSERGFSRRGHGGYVILEWQSQPPLMGASEADAGHIAKGKRARPQIGGSGIRVAIPAFGVPL